MPVTAIPTTYAGCRFRSRLEARWAVFFDALNITWRYEPQGYLIGDPHGPPTPYLPDFHLPDLNTWVEVKGDERALDTRLLIRAVDTWSENDEHGGGPLPGMHDTGHPNGPGGGLLILGDIPGTQRRDRDDPLGFITRRPARDPFAFVHGVSISLHTLLVHRKGVVHRHGMFIGTGRLIGGEHTSSAAPGCVMDSGSGERGCHAAGHCNEPWTRTTTTDLTWSELDLDKARQDAVDKLRVLDMPAVAAAYARARSARFEHGHRE